MGYTVLFGYEDAGTWVTATGESPAGRIVVNDELGMT
jgi:hypothetical protein